MNDKVKMNIVKAGDRIKLGCFGIEFIHTNHSIADSVALAIRTPLGTIIHTGDFKIDPTPVSGEMIDLTRFGELGREGVLALMSDSTNVERAGFTPSEMEVGKTLEAQFRGCEQRIIVATFASNIYRIQQILDAAANNGRKAAICGRSMENISSVALSARAEAGRNHRAVRNQQVSEEPHCRGLHRLSGRVHECSAPHGVLRSQADRNRRRR